MLYIAQKKKKPTPSGTLLSLALVNQTCFTKSPQTLGRFLSTEKVAVDAKKVAKQAEARWRPSKEHCLSQLPVSGLPINRKSQRSSQNFFGDGEELSLELGNKSLLRNDVNENV